MGATTTFFIEGVVRTVQGNPQAGVVVTASPTTLKSTSDATGRYIINGLAAGTYTLTVPSGTPDGFANPVTVGPSLQGRNFVLQSYPLTWDLNTSVAEAQDGGGNWANGAGNWFNQTTGANHLWNNNSLDSAIFGAGTDGTYAVTLSGAVQSSGGISFFNSGYTLSGTALSLVNGSLDGAITVAAGKTATINSTITYANNAAANITVNSGAILNLGGGAGNSQYNFLGSGGTVNMTAGTYSANVGSMSLATFNQTGGTFNITPGNNNGYNVSSNSRGVNFTLSGGTLTVNGNAATPTVNNAYLGIGNGTAISNTSTMTVKTGATVNVGTIADHSGEVRIANTPESNGTLEVQGGTLTVGTGNSANKIYFFKAGTIDAPYLARMSQSGGTVTANGIQFGGNSGAYDTASSAALQLSGGSLYVGAQGITRGSMAGDLPVVIQLQGGTIGASDSWSSSLDMQLGTTGGGPIFRAASSGGISKNITLSGVLSDDEGTGSITKTGSGMLTLTGANTFGDGVTLKNGTLESKTTTTTLGTGTVTMGGSGSTGATFITGQSNSNPFVINAPDSGSMVIGTNGGGSGFTMSGTITLNGNLTLQTYNNTISGTIKAVTNLTGGITGTGNLLLNNPGLAANTISITTATVNHSGSITLQGTATGDTIISAGIGSNVTGITQNSASSLMILSGANTYPGNLTVNAGLVRLSNAPDPLNANPGNDVSTVTIATTGATLNLIYTGTDKVDKLVIGSTQQANGVYGKVGSASPVIGLSQITGDGTLTVGTVTPPGFSSWITGTFANGTVPLDKRGPHDDPDNDGISNLVEYAIASQDPTVGKASIGTFTAGGALAFSKRLVATGITYDIESSTLLTADSWTTLPKPPVVESASAISYSFTPGTPVKNFARLKVTLSP